MRRLFAILLVGCGFWACSESEAPEPAARQFIQPEGFPPATYSFSNNPVSEEAFQLGRMLFYDPVLSRDGTVSCSSCHLQSAAFADALYNPSVGIDFATGSRNAPALFNLAFKQNFMLDGGVTHLDFTALVAFDSPVELDQPVAGLLPKLNADPEYQALFLEAFGTETIEGSHVLKALAQFQVQMTSDQSAYDHYLRGEGSLSSLELEGLKIFDAKCAVCHSGTLFTDGSFANNGLSAKLEGDPGRYVITENEADRGKFLVPSLRNLGFTAPYMHDGRFATLRQVLDHYSDGVKASATLDQRLQRNGQLGLALSDTDKDALEAFLRSLDDYDFVLNPDFSNPF